MLGDPSAGGVAFAEERADGVFNVGLEGGAGAVECSSLKSWYSHWPAG